MDLTTELESIQISDESFVKIHITCDEKIYVLEINYLDGRFVAEKQFPNNFNGIANMEETKSQFKCENDVRR